MFFKKKEPEPKALLLYTNIQDVIYSHSVLLKEGLGVSLVPPPAGIAAGCDLAVQFNPAEAETAKSLMHSGHILPGQLHYVACSIDPVENVAMIIEIEPGYLMAKCNNIKVTIDQANGEIVNISGGGCPDIPYVAQTVTGKTLWDCPEPVEIGSTLCTYMVQLAIDTLRQEVGRCWL
ncbi:MAG: hypothetical protein CVU89_04415 [Firmicutes bacterium HGW-Firmicutes-14]|nr:MAG: hypothetical protein CVU89_04415 [Firmicutes bacterium HGW-Firmicutes-14]